MKNMTTVNFDLTRTVKILKRPFYVLVFCSLIAVAQSCGPHYVAQVPMAGVVVRVDSPYAGAVWIDGGWAWRGGRYAYTSGYWDRRRQDKVYTAGEWRHNERGHYWV